MTEITAVTVCHNTTEMIINAVSSLRKYHNIPIIIVDGCDLSIEGRLCKQAIIALRNEYENVTIMDCHGKNVGHGEGLHIGIMKCNTPNVLIFDSDIIVKKPALGMFRDVSYYAQGLIVHCDIRGYNRENGIRYVHPHFALINRVRYAQFPRFRNGGAPCIHAMRQVDTLNPGLLIDINVAECVLHLERGTRVIIDERREEMRRGRMTA